MVVWLGSNPCTWSGEERCAPVQAARPASGLGSGVGRVRGVKRPTEGHCAAEQAARRVVLAGLSTRAGKASCASAITAPDDRTNVRGLRLTLRRDTIEVLPDLAGVGPALCLWTPTAHVGLTARAGLRTGSRATHCLPIAGRRVGLHVERRTIARDRACVARRTRVARVDGRRLRRVGARGVRVRAVGGRLVARVRAARDVEVCPAARSDSKENDAPPSHSVHPTRQHHVTVTLAVIGGRTQHLVRWLGGEAGSQRHVAELESGQYFFVMSAQSK